ncbi:MAG: thioredoxin domain-containing protein [Acidimicrobiia bacterium]|nr:thioredoxin domain-containing protein [Acidimicrobiia bacterium]
MSPVKPPSSTRSHRESNRPWRNSGSSLRRVNRLADETSPYLRQHAANPVDWYPWGADAFDRAREQDRPILLSVGYSACHWCHVMAHESFEDPDIAAVMNRLFVNVKVDREERPDVDAVYMAAVQAMTGRGGWPMTVFLTPDGQPFYGGTYFPPADRHGMPGFVRIMEAVADIWTTQRPDVLEQATKLQDAIEANTLRDRLSGTPDTLTQVVLDRAYENIIPLFDAVDGGFGRAPKFPPAMTIDFLVRRHQVEPDATPDAMRMATTTLDAMAAGGIYDHVGGGFARYSTDTTWLVPHFEKMLYDQALLVGAYLRGHLVTGRARYREVVEETIDYVLRDLRHDRGGFVSAQDADSEGIEGKFYLWSVDEISAICGDDAAEVIRYFGVTDAGNFTDPHTGYSGSILAQVDRVEDRPDAVRRALPQLLAARSTRVRPGLDDKVLTAWNGLFTRSLIEAAAAFGRADWMEAARTNLEFLVTHLRSGEGRLLRSWQADGGARVLGYAEDYAALIGALVTMAEFDHVRWLAPAIELAQDLRARFGDPESGGVFTTGADAEALITRPQDFFDNATPSENSLTADALLRLAAITGDAEIASGSRRLLAALGPTMAMHPTSFGRLLGAYERAVTPATELAIVGADDAFVAAWAARVSTNDVGVRSPDGTGVELTPLLAGRPLTERTLAYLCTDFVCQAPVDDAAQLRSELDV